MIIEVKENTLTIEVLTQGVQGPSGLSNNAVTSVNGLIGVVALTSNEVPDSTNKRYITESERTKLASQSGVNSGDQDLSSYQTSSASITALALKVDKITGKALSTEDYSTTEKAKLAAISGSNTGDQDLSGLVTNSSVTASLALKVDKSGAKVLSDENYSTSEKNKLALQSGTNTGDQALSDATISTTDITTNNFSTTKHGFVPKGLNAGKFLKDDGTWGTPAGGGGGDVGGPASAVADDIATYNSTTGKIIKDGGKTIAQVLDRANHTGSQAASTISDFSTAADARVAGGIAGKENTITATTIADYYRGDKTFQPLVKAAVGLSNVDNTSDANKPVSTAQQTALNLKADLASPTFTGTVSGITKSMVGLSSVDNTSDILKPVSTAQASANSSVQAFAIQRVNHTGTQSAGTITGLATVATTGVYSDLSGRPTIAVSTDGLIEGSTNLYFTLSRVLATVLGGLSLATNAAITSTDTILTALGKIQKQITDLITTVSGKLTASSNLSDVLSISTTRANIRIDKRTAFSNIDYSVLATDVLVSQIGTLTASRTVTLPLASTVNAGFEIIIVDESGSVNLTNTIIITRSGSDTIDGVTSFTIGAPYGMRRLFSDGTSRWIFDAGVLRSSNNLSDVANTATARTNIGAQPTLVSGTNIKTINGVTVLGSGDLAVSGLFPLALFGDGSNSDVTISSGTTTLTADIFYNNLTINGTGILNTAGFKLYVKGILDISAMQQGGIINNGAAGVAGSTAGTGGTASALTGEGTTSFTSSRQPGGAGGTAAGTAAAASGSNTGAIGGGCGVGGAGGLGSGGAGGAGTTASSATYVGASFKRYLPELLRISLGVVSPYILARNSSGGGGGGDGTSGGGGGSGGAQGGGVAIYAYTIARGSNTNTAIIQARGGGGGAGGAAIAGNRGGGGGGSGGPAGLIYICYANLTGSTITAALDTSGGVGGNGGVGFGTGIGGAGGGRGGKGRIVTINLITAVSTELVPDNGGAGGAASGVTAGTGAVQVLQQGDL